LLFLAVITLGIYAAHYIRKQTIVLNRFLEPKRHIPLSIANALFALGYGSFALLIAFIIFFDEGHPIENVLDVMDYTFLVLMSFWAFLARARMNHLLGATRLSLDWFNLFWSLFLTPYYFNFKVNRLAKRHERQCNDAAQ